MATNIRRRSLAPPVGGECLCFHTSSSACQDPGGSLLDLSKNGRPQTNLDWRGRRPGIHVACICNQMASDGDECHGMRRLEGVPAGFGQQALEGVKLTGFGQGRSHRSSLSRKLVVAHDIWSIEGAFLPIAGNEKIELLRSSRAQRHCSDV